VKVASITILILFTYDAFERGIVFDKNMIMRKQIESYGGVVRKANAGSSEEFKKCEKDGDS
jgi:hypothetical protein